VEGSPLSLPMVSFSTLSHRPADLAILPPPAVAAVEDSSPASRTGSQVSGLESPAAAGAAAPFPTSPGAAAPFPSSPGRKSVADAVQEVLAELAAAVAATSPASHAALPRTRTAGWRRREGAGARRSPGGACVHRRRRVHRRRGPSGLGPPERRRRHCRCRCFQRSGSRELIGAGRSLARRRPESECRPESRRETGSEGRPSPHDRPEAPSRQAPDQARLQRDL